MFSHQEKRRQQEKLLGFLVDTVIPDWGPVLMKGDWEQYLDPYFNVLSAVSVFLALTQSLQTCDSLSDHLTPQKKQRDT